MKFKDPVLEGTFLKRYKRFFADIRYNNEVVVAHVANTGSMKGLLTSETRCRMTYLDSPTRKLKFTLQALHDGNSWVGINTALPNGLVREAFENKKIMHWLGYETIASEVKINKESRLDHKLSSPGKPDHFIEVKNVTLAENGVARFPDSVTARGLKHLGELAKLIDEGFTAEMVFVVQRTDCAVFEPAHDIDPEYAKGLAEAKKAGVKLTAYPVEFSDDGIELVTQKEIEIRL